MRKSSSGAMTQIGGNRRSKEECEVIELTSQTGSGTKRHYVSAENISRITEAGVSSRWHGIRSIVKLFDGDALEVEETADWIAGRIAAHDQEIVDLHAETTRLTKIISDCRDALPIPAPGSATENEWMAAMGEPESVPYFVGASFVAQAAEIERQSERHAQERHAQERHAQELAAYELTVSNLWERMAGIRAAASAGFKIDWAKAIEDAAIDYADAYVELQCDSDNHQRSEQREALRNLRETIRRGLECAATPQPAAQPEPLTDVEILGLGPGQDDAPWPSDSQIYFGRATIAAHAAKKGGAA